MCAKVLRRLVVLWCMFGAWKCCVFANPWLFRIAEMLYPYWDDNSEWDVLENELWDAGSIEQRIFVWFWTAIVIALLIAASASMHVFTSWLFNENEDE